MWNRLVSLATSVWRQGGARGLLGLIVTKIVWRGDFIRWRIDLADWEDRGPAAAPPLGVRRGVLSELETFGRSLGKPPAADQAR